MRNLKTYSDFLNERVEMHLSAEQEKFLNEVCGKDKWKVNDEGKVDVNGNVSMDRTKWEEIPVKFGKVTGSFWCQHCYHLKSLEGAPEEVGEHFNCMYCSNLKSFEGAPKKIGGAFEARYCNNVKTLMGAPPEVGGKFLIEGCVYVPFYERELAKDDRLRSLWLKSGLPYPDFMKGDHRGEIRGKKFGI